MKGTIPPMPLSTGGFLQEGEALTIRSGVRLKELLFMDRSKRD